MKFHNLLILLILSVTLCSCLSSNKGTTATTVYTACTTVAESNGTCTRFMDRDIYFANNIASEPDVNNGFDIQVVKDSLTTIATNSNLGDNYFRFHTTDKAELTAITEKVTGVTFKSFIQVIPDLDYTDANGNTASGFNTLWNSGNYSDPNAIVIINQANKHQFYILLRGSCFTANSSQCTNNSSLSFTSNKGMYSLMARSLGRLVGLTNVSCATYPNHLMCADYPSDNQWSLTEQNRTWSLINNALETVSNNARFYEEVFVE